MKNLSKIITKTINYENDTKKGEKSKLLKVADIRKITPILVKRLSK